MAKKYTADTFEGDVTGDITGNLTGNVTGNVTGDVTGDVTGSASLNVLKAGDTMTGDLKIQKSAPVFELNSNSIYPYGRIEFAGSSYQPFEIVGQGNPGGTSLALRGQPSSSMIDAYQLKFSGSSTVYNYFPAPLRIGADSISNELDDYEEGTYNMQWSLGGTTNYSITTANFGFYASNTSRYVKIGRVVHIFLDFEFSDHPSTWASSGSYVYLTNLPFSPLQGSVGGNFSMSWNSDLNSTEQVLFYGGAGHFGQHATLNNSLIQLGPNGRYTGGYYSYWSNTWSLLATDFPAQPPGGANSMVGQITYYTND